jgi:N-acetylmuramoyl-L-alanine amidase
VARDRFNGLDQKTRKRYIRWGIVSGNVLLLLVVSTFILANRSASQTVRSSTFNSATGTASSIANPLDQLSSAQIALTAAQAARLPELSAIRNQADSDSITLRVIPNDAIAVAKPQIVTTAQKSKQDIKTYVTQGGDTISSVADKFGVSANSIKWSNNIGSNTLAAGVKLLIPPVNGIVYTVKAGDTPTSLATRFQSDASQIISYNDAEISGLKPGEQIIIPNGQIYVPAVSYAPSLSYASFVASYGGNGYDYGYCTWYVANRVAVPNNWGNANTWDNYAALSGWTVSSQPVAGAIAQTDAGWEGHVAYVEAVSPDGTQMKYSDMNGLAGWGRVGYSDWVPANRFPHYIYH